MITVDRETHVSPGVALLLEQAGFDWDDCRGCYVGSIFIDDCFNNVVNATSDKKLHAPSLSVAQRWLREVKKYHIYVRPYSLDDETYVTNIVISDSMWGPLWDDSKKAIIFKTHEEALEAGEKKALELILEKKGK